MQERALLLAESDSASIGIPLHMTIKNRIREELRAGTSKIACMHVPFWKLMGCEGNIVMIKESSNGLTCVNATVYTPP